MKQKTDTSNINEITYSFKHEKLNNPSQRPKWNQKPKIMFTYDILGEPSNIHLPNS